MAWVTQLWFDAKYTRSNQKNKEKMETSPGNKLIDYILTSQILLSVQDDQKMLKIFSHNMN